MNNTETLPFEIWEIDHADRTVTLLHEQGVYHLSYLYESNEELVEIAEGGYVVASGWEYRVHSIQLTKVIDENDIFVAPSWSNEQITQIKNYIEYETERELNGWD